MPGRNVVGFDNGAKGRALTIDRNQGEVVEGERAKSSGEHCILESSEISQTWSSMEKIHG